MKMVELITTFSLHSLSFKTKDPRIPFPECGWSGIAFPSVDWIWKILL